MFLPARRRVRRALELHRRALRLAPLIRRVRALLIRRALELPDPRLRRPAAQLEMMDNGMVVASSLRAARVV